MKSLKVFLLVVTAMTLLWSANALAATTYFEETFSSGLGQFTAVNNGGTCIWVSPGTNGTMNTFFGNGEYAEADSDGCGSGTTMNTSITSDPIDLSSATTVLLTFNNYYRYLSSDYGKVEVSPDNGTSWVEVVQFMSTTSGAVSYDVSATLAGVSQALIRFTYFAPGWDWYWGVDDVKLVDEVSSVLSVSTDSGAKSARPGKGLYYYVNVASTIGDKATVNLDYTGNTWDVTGPDTLDLNAGEDEWIRVYVEVPDDATVGATDSVTVTASYGTKADNVVLTTTAMAKIEVLPGWADTPPTIDGAIDAVTEWADADVIAVTGTLAYTMYFLADGDYLYGAFDVTGDAGLADWDQIGVYFDNENDGVWPLDCTYADGNYWIEYFAAGNAVDYRTWYDAFAPAVCDIVSGTAVTVAIALSTDANVQYEFAVDLDGGELYGAEGESIGIRFYANDTTSGALQGWPTDSTFNLPWTYATLTYPTAGGDDDTTDDDTTDDDTTDDDTTDDDT